MTPGLKWRLVPLICFLLPACQQKMAVQPSGRPDEPSAFFPDGRVARPLVPGTVARGHLRTDQHLFAGKRTVDSNSMSVSAAAFLLGAQDNVINVWSLTALAQTLSLENAQDVDTFPFPVTRAVLDQGRSRYMIYCVVCHDSLGTGHGKIVERGYTQPPSYHIPRLRQVAVGHFFDVITNGYGSMPDYKQQIPAGDRWAIAAYLRALQLSQYYPAENLPADLQEERRQAVRRDAP